MATNRCVSLAGLTPSQAAVSTSPRTCSSTPHPPGSLALEFYQGWGSSPRIALWETALQPKRPWMGCCCHTCTSSLVIPAPPAALSCAGSGSGAQPSSPRGASAPAEHCPLWGPAYPTFPTAFLFGPASRVRTSAEAFLFLFRIQPSSGPRAVTGTQEVSINIL